MDDKNWQQIVQLTKNVANDKFAEDVYSFLCQFADIAYFSVFIYRKNQMTESDLALYGGHISDYWMKANTINYKQYSQTKNEVVDKNLLSMLVEGQEKESFYHFLPDENPNSKIYQIYSRSKILEKFYYLYFRCDQIFQFNLYRAEDKGSFNRVEIEKVKEVLPFLTHLACLRFQVCGVGDYQKRSRKSVVSQLKQQSVPGFAALSAREAQVCDLIIFGLTTEGISVELDVSISSVKTFRNRAYRKLNISSKSELFVMILNNRSGHVGI